VLARRLQAITNQLVQHGQLLSNEPRHGRSSELAAMNDGYAEMLWLAAADASPWLLRPSVASRDGIDASLGDLHDAAWRLGLKIGSPEQEPASRQRTQCSPELFPGAREKDATISDRNDLGGMSSTEPSLKTRRCGRLA